MAKMPAALAACAPFGESSNAPPRQHRSQGFQHRQVDVGGRLGVLHVVATAHRGERVQQTDALQVCVDPEMGGGRRHPQMQAGRGGRRHQLRDPGAGAKQSDGPAMPDAQLVALRGNVDAGANDPLEMLVRIEMRTYATAPQRGGKLHAMVRIQFMSELERRALRIDDQPVEVEYQGMQRHLRAAILPDNPQKCARLEKQRSSIRATQRKSAGVRAGAERHFPPGDEFHSSENSAVSSSSGSVPVASTLPSRSTTIRSAAVSSALPVPLTTPRAPSRARCRT